MSVTMTDHPPAPDLAAFALGKLDGPSAERVQAHITTCMACRTIAEHAPPDSLVNLLGRAGAPRTCTYAPTPSGQGAEVPTLAPGPADLPAALRDHSRYRILRLLGRGGMGVVYQAEHKVMERLVAVKVISHALVAKPDALERFHREVRAAAKLDHPNIVKAYDAEQAGDLQLLAMEYVEGKSLADVLNNRGPLPIANACHYVRQAALGLQHAFERGMVHRDLKPQNLMLTPKGVVKILDFGLAKLASESDRPGAELTQDNMVMGTPEYMAPEQALDSRTADVRADIYALGCTLYCLLTGRPPFGGDEPLAIMVAHAQDAPPAVESLRPDVPEPLAALLQRLLAKDPARRPQTPKELAEALLPFAKAMVVKPVAKVDAPEPAAESTWAKLAAVRTPGTRRMAKRPLWVPAAVAAGLLLTVGGMMAAIVMWLPVPGGVVKLEVDPLDAKVEVVDGKITVSRPGEAEPWRIELAGEKGQLKISKAGFQVKSQQVTLSNKGQTIMVKLEPSDPVTPPVHPVVIRPAPLPAGNPASEPNPLAADKARSYWTHSRGHFRQVDGNTWTEKINANTNQLQETGRAENWVELHRTEPEHNNRDVWVRLTSNTCLIIVGPKGPNNPWRKIYDGHWETPKEPASPAPSDDRAEPIPPAAPTRTPVPAAKSAPALADSTLAVDLGGGVSITFVRIPAGSFTMGSPVSEAPKRDGEDEHPVRITRDFFLGKYPVTQAQYQAIVGSNPSRFKDGDPRLFPVEKVSWEDATAFCKKLSARDANKRIFRLPTEAEWEYACRGGAEPKTAYYFGNSLNGTQANCHASNLKRTSQVGVYEKYYPHNWGLCDMHGNVWQWCQDWYDVGFYQRSPVDDPICTDRQEHHVKRGGSWFTPAAFCRSATRRFRNEEVKRLDFVGFRVAYRPD